MIYFFSLLLIGGVAFTQANGKKTGDRSGTCTFIDENGDGINDNYRDHDGDGIPNYQDPDWQKPQDGNKNRNVNRIQNRRNRQSNDGNGSGFYQQSRINRFSRNQTGFNRASRMGSRARQNSGNDGGRGGRGKGF